MLSDSLSIYRDEYGHASYILSFSIEIFMWKSCLAASFCYSSSERKQTLNSKQRQNIEFMNASLSAASSWQEGL